MTELPETIRTLKQVIPVLAEKASKGLVEHRPVELWVGAALDMTTSATNGS